MTYRCMIVDDEELARELIERHLSLLDKFEVVASCASAIEASRVLQDQKIDLLFLDIEMPMLKGTDFFKNLVERPQVIFTTAYREYAIDGFDLNAVDYLLKPITFERIFRATEKFLKLQAKDNVVPSAPIKIDQNNEDFVFIRKNRKQVKLILSNVLYIESLKDYIKIYEEDKTHTIKYSISHFQDLLNEKFLRVHRSFIVNFDKVTAYSKHDVEIEDKEIPIGESYKNEVLEYLKNSFNQFG